MARDDAPSNAEPAGDETKWTASAPRSGSGTGIMWPAVGLLAAFVLFLVVAFQNTDDVEFNFLWFDWSIPLILILAITFGVAVVCGEVIGFVWRHRRRKRRRERDELKQLRDQS